jgi:hypothetical protein
VLSSSAGVETKAKEKGKAKKFAARGDEDDDGGEEVFDLDAVSDTSDGEDIEVLAVKKPKVKEVEKSKSQPKARKAPAESQSGTAPAKKASTAATTTTATTTASSKGDKDKADRAKAVEVENAPVPVVKPKKRTFNLLGSTTSNALTGVGLNRFGLLGGVSSLSRSLHSCGRAVMLTLHLRDWMTIYTISPASCHPLKRAVDSFREQSLGIDF